MTDLARAPSLKLRVRRLLTVTFVIIGVITLLTAVSFVRLLEARSEVLDEIGPSRVAAVQLLSAYIDQENGVRGYVISQGEEVFLEPFRVGREEADRLRDQLGRGLASFSALDEARDRVDATTTRWSEEHAAPAIAAVRAGATPEQVDFEEGRVLFDEVRDAFDILLDDLAVERSRVVDELNTATSFLLAAVAALAAMSITSKIVLWRTYHRAVAEPLDALGADATAIAGGDLGRHIDVPEHLELAQVGVAMEEMRVRLVNDLRAIEITYAELLEKAAELERSNDDLEQFAYVASHDLQEPLRKVISFTQLLQNRYGDQLDERADQYIAYAVDGARRMQDLINDLLAFSRVGRLTRAHVPVDLDGVVDQAISNLGESVDAADATVDVADLPTIVGDPILLVSLFQNLIGNSVKFRRPDEAPTITIDAQRDDAAGSWTMRVTDNGIGIEPEYGERVFVIFQRLHGKDVYSGTGIGLSMCRKIVEHHGGTIHIEQPDGPGTRFILTFPDRDGDDVEATEPAEQTRSNAT